MSLILQGCIYIFLGTAAVLCACYVAVQLEHAGSYVFTHFGPAISRVAHIIFVVIKHYFPAVGDDLQLLIDELNQ